MRPGHLATRDIYYNITVQNLSGSLQLGELFHEGCLLPAVSLFRMDDWLPSAPPIIPILFEVRSSGSSFLTFIRTQKINFPRYCQYVTYLPLMCRLLLFGSYSLSVSD